MTHYRVGYDIALECANDTPMLLLLNIHPTRRADLIYDTPPVTEPFTAQQVFQDAFGNACSLMVAPSGVFRLRSEAVISDDTGSDAEAPLAQEVPVASLPAEAFAFLTASRYCETDLLLDFAWQHFAAHAPGWTRVQAICDYVHTRLVFDYQHACHTRTAQQALHERLGVCRDYAHLAITLCRCLNLPARYCMGYVVCVDGKSVEPADFAAWIEVYLSGRWYTFDPRNNRPCTGRVLLARGRDAADVPMINAFGEHQLLRFAVKADQLVGFGYSSIPT